MAQSTLTLVRKGGAAIKVIGEKRQNLDLVFRGSMKQMRLGAFRVSRTGFYRFDLVIKHGADPMHRYREYFRVVPRRVELRLALSSSTPRPGEKLTWRLENFGTLPFSYGLSYRIDRFSDGKWVIDPITPRGFPDVGFASIAGAASECQILMLPPEMAPGRYRVSKTARSGSARDRTVSSEFWIGLD